MIQRVQIMATEAMGMGKNIQNRWTAITEKSLTVIRGTDEVTGRNETLMDYAAYTKKFNEGSSLATYNIGHRLADQWHSLKFTNVTVKNEVKKRSKITLFILLLHTFFFIPYSFSAQTFWISFTDKSHNRYSLSNPEEFLSQKSLERRKLQGITLTEDDLPISELYITELKSIGCNVVSKLKWFNAVVVNTDNTFSPSQFNSLSFIKEIKNWTSKPDRIKKQPDKFELERQLKNTNSSPRLPYTKPMSGNKYKYGKAEKQITIMNGHFLHNNGFDGRGVIIALLDGGFDGTKKKGIFDSTFKTGRYMGCRDFVLPGDTNTIWTASSSYHGTWVFSTMGTNKPGKMVGTAPQAKYLFLRTENNQTEKIIEETYWAQGAEFADSVGADVINSSVGYTKFDDTTKSHVYERDMNGHTTIVANAADKASERGILVVCAAGNDGGTKWKYIATPADADSIITVGSVNSSGNIAGFSSYGPSADGDIKPNVVALGQAVSIVSTFGEVATSNGTSFSSPIMCGMVACIRQAFPKISVMKIIQAIQKNSSKASNPDDRYGYGIPDFKKIYDTLKNEPTKIDKSIVLNTQPVCPITIHSYKKTLTFTLSKKVPSNFHIALFTPKGTNVHSSKVSHSRSTHSIDLSQLPQGMYIAILKVDSKKLHQRIIIQ